MHRYIHTVVFQLYIVIFLMEEDKRMKAKKVNITETVLRDANQSLIATRLPCREGIAPFHALA